MRYDTILFDMDGTLFDTERIYRSAWHAAGISDELYQQFIGRDRPHILALIRENTTLDPESVQEKRNAYVDAALQDGIPFKPHLLETLTWLADHGYHNCIATSSAMAIADRYLSITGTGRFFEHVVSGNTLEHGKPAPDIYLLAADTMHARPSQCVVVEDSYNGVRSGHAAGMNTVMIPDEIEPDEEMKRLADGILPELGALPEYLQTLNESSGATSCR